MANLEDVDDELSSNGLTFELHNDPTLKTDEEGSMSSATAGSPGSRIPIQGGARPLLEHEIELRRAMEAVAAARRELPPGGPVPEDYVFEGAGADGTSTDVRLSELFAPSKDSLEIYSFMFPRDARDQRPGPTSGETALLPLAEGPCPSCGVHGEAASARSDPAC